MFVCEYHPAVWFYYLRIQGISAFDAKTESDLNRNTRINAGDEDQAEVTFEGLKALKPPTHGGDCVSLLALWINVHSKNHRIMSHIAFSSN